MADAAAENKGPLSTPMSRRSALKLGLGVGLGAGAAALTGLPIVSAFKELQSNAAKTPEQRFQEAGLSDLFPFYQAVDNLRLSYRAQPAYWYDVNLSFDPYYLLDYVANGRLEPLLMARIRDGWGGKVSERDNIASDRAKNATIKIDPDLPDNEESVRNYLAKLNALLPYHGAIVPDTIHIIPGGGFNDSISWDQLGRPKPTEIAVCSPAINGAGFYVSGMHEYDHNEVDWIAGKAFTTRKAWGRFMATEARMIKEVLDRYFSLDWQQAKIFKQGAPLILTSDNQDMSSLIVTEHDLQKFYGITLDDPSATSDELKDPSYRYNRLAHAVGRRRQLLLRKNQSELNEHDNDFLNSIDIPYQLLKATVDELHHYFVGPVQKKGGGLPEENLASELSSDFLSQANQTVQLARLEAFSSLSPEELVDFPHASTAIMRRLDLHVKPAL